MTATETTHRTAPDTLRMPALYFERTTPEEQARHREKLSRMTSGGELLIDPVAGEDGGWDVEIVTMDWEEPGLLDRIFEAILKCNQVPGGIAFRRIRVFTGPTGQVVNILELQDERGDPLSRERVEMVLEQLRLISRGERAVLETIMNLTFTTLIPLLTEFPYLDNDRSADYTVIELEVSRLSNRFTSMLLHFLARSEFRVNVQVAEFVQGDRSRYTLWVLDKNGRKVRDSHFNRLGMVRALEAMNRMILGFNLHYIRKPWKQRIERNEATIYRSRPDPNDFLEDLENIRDAARMKGFPNRLSALVESRLLENNAFYFLKKFESFCREHMERFHRLVETSPDDDDVALCREYFEQRRRSLRIVEPLFDRLMEMEPIEPHPSDAHRLHALCRPMAHDGFALDPDRLLYLTGSIWIADPLMAFQPFMLMARTGCFLKPKTQDAVEAALEEWSPAFVAEHRGQLGALFGQILDESLRQGNAAVVLRNLRQVGLLQRYIPGFDRITGMIHIISDHTYTVDEHSILVVETLSGMALLAEALPDAGPSRMRTEYEELTSAIGLANFARKYVVEERMLRMVPQLRNHPAVKPYFQVMDEVRATSLEYMVEVNLLEHSHATCMTALHQVETVRRQMNTLIRLYNGLPFSEQRNLLLAALFHDMKKPDPDHGRLFSPAVGSTLDAMGMTLPEGDVSRIAWLVHHHLDLTDLTRRVGERGEDALRDYMAEAGDPSLVRALILLTYADRVAVLQDPNRGSHNAMVLSELLDSVDGLAAE